MRKNLKKIINKFINAEINTQQSISNDSIIDIFIKGNDGNIYIENKVDSNEGERTDHKEPKFIKNKKNSKTFKHIHLEEIYDYLKDYNQKRKSEIISHILSYMEELFMMNIKFTKEELNSAKNAFSFITKSNQLLKEIWGKIGYKIEEKFGKNTSNKVRKDRLEHDAIYFRYTPSNKWKFEVDFFIYINEKTKKPYLSISILSISVRFIKQIEKDFHILKKINVLKRKGWKYEQINDWLEIYKEFELKPKPINKITNELTPKILKAIDELIKSRIIQMLANRSKKIPK
jgi:hypothetical protein